MTGKTPNPKALRALDRALDDANRYSSDFDAIFGRLPSEAAGALHDIVAYVRHYLLKTRRLSVSRVKHLAAQLIPRHGFRSLCPEVDDEGIIVALGVLNSIASVLRIVDGKFKLNGRPLSGADAITYLVSGSISVRRRQQQRASARKGSQQRTDARKRREARWIEIARPLRGKHPDWSNAELARHVADSQDVHTSESTIRQAIPRLGLSKKPDR